MSETPTLTPEQRAVVEADLCGPRLVDAGAGTGKTFTIVKRAAELIRRGVLRADELLVVTFTKAAANEIAGRLATELPSTAGDGEAPHARPACGTFHGIAADVLREFAYETGTSPDVRVIDDGRARGVFARAFADLCAGRLDVDLAAFPLLERTKALERNLAGMALALKARGADIDAELARAHDAAGHLATLPIGGVRMLQLNGRPRAEWPRPDPERTPDERRTEAERERANVAVVAALFARFQALLDEEQLLTFGDLLVRATRMIVVHPPIGQRLRARWKHAIVDEFQDTNDTQIAFLEAIFGPTLEPLLVVGDVRQAIYEFNGARPQGIVEFRSRARETFALTVNRRSVQPVLDAAQHVLTTHPSAVPGHVAAAALRAHRGDADRTCVRRELFVGEGSLEREAEAIAGALRGLVDGGIAPRSCAVLLRTRMRAGVYAQAIRDRGLSVQLHGGVGFFDAAEIRDVVAWLRLADDTADPMALTAALQSAAIGVSDGGVALLAGSGAFERAALFDALPAELSPAECTRIERFRRVARIVCGLTDAPVVEAVRTVVWASGAEIARAGDEPGLVQVRANLDKLIAFTAEFAVDRPHARLRDLVAELREREELDLDLPIAHVDGDRVSIMTIHAAKGLEWDHVFLADVGASFPLNNTGQMDKVAQFDALTGALALKHAVDGRITLRWFLTEHVHDDAGVVPTGPADRTSAKAEEFRLLYVALTRARDAVAVTGRAKKGQTVSPSECFKAIDGWVAAVSGPDADHSIRALAAQRAQLTLPLGTGSQPDLGGRLTARDARSFAARALVPERRGALSYTAMALHDECPRRARYHYVLGLPDLRDDAPMLPDGADPAQSAEDTDRVERNPARYGRVIHRALELVARARIDGQPADRETALALALADEGWSPPAPARAAALTAIDRAASVLADVEPISAERRFETSIDGVRMSGFIDLIARDTARGGAPVIIDYKTGQSAADRYALQFGLYAYAVRDEFPGAATAVLRIADETVRFEPIVPATIDALRHAVASAASMESDDPRPGPVCRHCPYAGDVCSAATSAAAI